MNPFLKQSIALVAVLAVGVSSVTAGESRSATPLLPALPEEPLTAPSIAGHGAPMDAAELAKYSHLAEQAQDLAAANTAGASQTTKVVLVVVGVVAVAAVVFFINLDHGRDHILDGLSLGS